MDLFRVFDWDGVSTGRSPGGPLFVARSRQGAGRHDAPARYGAWYCSRRPTSAIAETLQYLRGHEVSDEDFTRSGGLTKAIVLLRVDRDSDVVDLDDPTMLVSRSLRPSRVATRRRAMTQRIAASIFDEGAAGLSWWSTLNADWANVTLFHERALRDITIVTAPLALSTRLPDVREAAEALGIDLVV